MKKALYVFFVFWILMVAFIFFMPRADANMYAKPVICGPPQDIYLEWDKFEMYPLIAFGGMSWLEDGSTQSTVTVVVVNQENRFAIVEKNGEDICLLSAGNVVEYNSEAIKEIMDWK